VFIVCALSLWFQFLGAASLSLHECNDTFSRSNTQLKDHTIFKYRDYYYLASIEIHLPTLNDRGEYDFAYARTRDFCNWEDLGNILGEGKPHNGDEQYVWAPYVFEENGVYYLFYTGVNEKIAQSIMLATTTTPDDPTSWQKHGVIFRPNHPNMVYAGSDRWSDARDPMVLKHNEIYYLYYSGLDTTGGIVGVASSSNLLGNWKDWGAVILTHPKTIPESPYVFEDAGVYHMFYNEAGGKGPVWRWSVSPLGPWQKEVDVLIGWAHDLYFDKDIQQWFISYVLGNGEAIRVVSLNWAEGNYPPRVPLIGSRVFLPNLLKVVTKIELTPIVVITPKKL
jgi:beta-xylosidase